ncbi:serine/threonine protein kinase [Sphingomonas xinjiangensis]|uniref:Serine/threonine protein kinase n=1 Tax=Sphingomonas xinjiangensis TaxID=643568 RepID=A0A840YS40_9SPHN|nr:protein kinase [Sphingomonas xinjiangensis]MBB5712501.1 serine/threonine protein kinase [Sphingomonas xinjiangensis]
MISLNGYKFSEARYGSATIRRAVAEHLPPLVLLDEGGQSLAENAALCARALEVGSSFSNLWAEEPIGLVEVDGRQSLAFADNRITRLDGLLGRPMDISHFLSVASAVTEAVAQMHRSGHVHRALRPWHLFLRPDNNVGIVGLGRVQGLSSDIEHDVLEASADDLAYVAPEQIRRPARSDEHSDLYALGIIFYEMLAARRPFDGGDPLEWAHAHTALTALPPSTLRPLIPSAVSDLIMRLLSKDPEDRFQSAGSLREALKRLASAWLRPGIERIGAHASARAWPGRAARA